jgi:fumarylpyruvate hydrolase
VGHSVKGAIWLKVNGELKQRLDMPDLIWSVPEIIAFISQAVDLAPGDLIFSGTPAGVGPMQPGDEVAGGVQGIEELAFTIGPRMGA